MDADPEFDRPGPKRPLPPRRGGRLVRVLLGVACTGVLIGLFLPATRSSRGAARRSQCANNLKQIALALRNYEGQYGALPPAWTVDADGWRLHSWRTLILPFLDYEDLYRRIDLTKPWDDPINADAARAMPTVFHCPELLDPPSSTTYLAMVGPDNCFPPDGSRRLAEIARPDTTLMLVEAGPDSAVPWMAPRDADESMLLGIGPTIDLDHVGGTNAAFVDGSVHFLKRTEPAADRRAMLAITPETQGPTGPGGPPSSPDPGGTNPTMPR